MNSEAPKENLRLAPNYKAIKEKWNERKRTMNVVLDRFLTEHSFVVEDARKFAE